MVEIKKARIVKWYELSDDEKRSYLFVAIDRDFTAEQIGKDMDGYFRTLDGKAKPDRLF